ncbi:hypothetical protein HS088_TW06G00688 [Tripterygium wilfordii]|uniref:Uncharacterized protein n=1 Tax=Tripterygium wilfordii TaxID=458696 RepID=A0A7J7DJL8_TRIWF|nr:hypothetical protein HS088_TW06G00688 [Tripterygium wilfordii]
MLLFELKHLELSHFNTSKPRELIFRPPVSMGSQKLTGKEVVSGSAVGGAVAATAAPGGGGSAPAAEEKKEEEKKPEKESEDKDMGFSLFD